MKLLLLECKKMLCNKGMLLLLLLLFAVNFGKILIFLHYNPMLPLSLTRKTDAVYQKYENKYEGEMTEEKANEVIAGYQAYDDYMSGKGEYKESDAYCYSIYPRYKYLYTYHEMMQGILDEVADNAEFYQSKNNPSRVELNQLIQKLYSGRHVDKYYNSEDFSFLFQYQFSTLLLVIFALILSFQFFYQEKENGMYQMLISLGKKRHTVFARKYIVLFFGIFLAGVLLYAQDYILYVKMLYLRGSLNPIYAVPAYSNCPLNVSILGFYLLSCIIRIGMIFLLALAFVLIEQMFLGRILPVLAAGLAALCVVFTGDQYLNIGTYGTELHVMSLGNHVVQEGYVWLAVYAVLLVAVSVLLHRSFKCVFPRRQK